MTRRDALTSPALALLKRAQGTPGYREFIEVRVEADAESVYYPERPEMSRPGLPVLLRVALISVVSPRLRSLALADDNKTVYRIYIADWPKVMQAVKEFRNG